MNEIEELLKTFNTRAKVMTLAERRAMHQAQRESFAREIQPCEHGVADFEDCEDCRRKAGVK